MVWFDQNFEQSDYDVLILWKEIQEGYGSQFAKYKKRCHTETQDLFFLSFHSSGDRMNYSNWLNLEKKFPKSKSRLTVGLIIQSGEFSFIGQVQAEINWPFSWDAVIKIPPLKRELTW